MPNAFDNPDAPDSPDAVDPVYSLPLVTVPRPITSFSTSGGMRREEMVRRGKALMGETDGTDGGGSPFEWNSLLSEAADDLCRGTYCFYTRFTLPLVPAQADYCAPPLFRLVAAFLQNPATGDVIRLVEATKRDLDGWGGYGWPYLANWNYFSGDIRFPATPGTPALYLWGGLSALTLYPPPSSAIAAGYNLVCEGWATTEGQWDGDTDTCPLPARLHPTVIDGACLLRAAQYSGTANLALIQARYLAARGKAEREAATFARRQAGVFW